MVCWPFESQIFVGSCTYKHNSFFSPSPVNLSYVNLIFRSATKPGREENIFTPLQHQLGQSLKRVTINSVIKINNILIQHVGNHKQWKTFMLMI